MQSIKTLFIGLVFLLISQSAMAVFAINPDAQQQVKTEKEIRKGHFKSNNFVIHKSKPLSLKDRLAKRILQQKSKKQFKRKFKKKRVEARPSAVISLITGILAIASFVGSIAASFAVTVMSNTILISLIVLTGLFAIGALFFGFKALKKNKAGDGNNATNVMAIIGLLLGGLAGLIWLIFLIGAAIG